MTNPIKKLTKTIGAPLLFLPVLFTTSLTASAETVDERISKLELLVKQLKQEVNREKQAKSEKQHQQPASLKKLKTKPQNSYSFGGFIKATASITDYSDGDLASGSAGRDFYIPATIPVGGQSEGEDFDFSAKETRINFKSKHYLDNGEAITTNIEMDFLLPPGGNERVSNSYNPRMRHAYFTYGNWLFGQTWSTFQDVGALPESVDFLAASDGIVFERQPMVRYTKGPWQFALENPETTITPFGGGGRIVADDNGTPDIVARYNHRANWGHISLAALFRELAYDTGSIDNSTSSTGFSLTGKLKVGSKDDIRFNFASGSGMGRYVGLNTANSAVLDANGDLEAIDSTLGAVAYRHFWNAQWRSNFVFSAMSIDNDVNLTGVGVTESVESFQVNLLFSPVKKLTFGVGVLSAERELESGLDGDFRRLMFSAKYGF
ncbi:DcaP family trimeric outer membrane transporter [Aliikangiella coralliicola]|uniref:DcaP family trimeric outer membrane transporter n=1 Tax=Aliikangiella coralliicola TaxID=2592383 RepID=UPI001AEF724B|nr:DcaP family trimeric outer membrane transporter [Aliikangiella coralliicola]